MPPFDFRAELESLDGLPESVAITDIYVEGEDGKFRLPPKIEGFKPTADFERINEALRKERNDHKTVKDRIKVLGDRDLEEVVDQLSEIDELKTRLEAAEADGGAGIDQDKIDEMVEKRLNRLKAPLERSLTAITKERDDLSTREISLVKSLDGHIIGTTVTTLGTKMAHPDALDDILMCAGSHLCRDAETGEVTTRDDVKGITPNVTAEMWLQEMLEKRPLWNKPSGGGGGGRGSQGGGGPTKNPFTHDGWNLQAQNALVQEKGIEEWRRMAKAAGVDPNRPRRPASPNGRAAA